MSSFKFQKTILAVSALAGMLFNTQAFAQSNTEKGSVDVAGKLITSTCALNLDSTASTSAAAAKKTLDLGTLSLASISSVGGGSQVGNGRSQSVVLSLKEANGSAGCTAIGQNGKWDVSVDLSASQLDAASSLLTNTTTGANAASGFGAALLRSVNGATGTYITSTSRSPLGILVSGSTTTPNLNATDLVTLTVNLFRNGSAPTVGTYTATVPFTVLYK